jgi:amphi-Trp domain-containing protein
MTFTFHDQYRIMTRSEVADDMRRLASQLESGGPLAYGSGRIEVPNHLAREFEIDQTADGSELKLEFKLKWTAPNTSRNTCRHHRRFAETPWLAAPRGIKSADYMVYHEHRSYSCKENQGEKERTWKLQSRLRG